MLEAFRESDWFGRLDRRAHAIAEAVLLRDNGIEARRLALDSLADSVRHRSRHAAAPLRDARAGARRPRRPPGAARRGPRRPDIDAVVVSTCTGYLCPGLTSYVVERLGLRADVQAFDLVGQGCAAALPNLATGRGAARRRRMRARAVDLRRGQQRRDVPRQRSRRADQRLPVRRRRGRRGAVARGRRSASAAVEWDSALADRIRPSATRCGSSSAAACCATSSRGRCRGSRPSMREQVLDSDARRGRPQVARHRAWIMHAGGRDVLQALQERLGLSRRTTCATARRCCASTAT